MPGTDTSFSADSLSTPIVVQLTEGFRAAVDAIGDNWGDMVGRIGESGPVIAGQAAPEVARRLPAYTKANIQGRLKRVLFLPTGPGPRKDTTIKINREWDVNVGVSGGRLFGFGLRTSKRNVDQIFRIDYWEKGKLDLHYHIYGGRGQSIP